MQELLNSNWYSHNEMIAYPLENAGEDDNGNILPSPLITDLRIVSSVNLDFFIGGVTCTEYIISVIVCSSRGTETMITVPQPVEPETHYAMESLTEEVSGVIAFGHTDTYGQWKFSRPEQSRLCPSCQIKLRKWPVSSLGAESKLVGDVILSGGASVTVETGTVAIGNSRYDKNPRYKEAIIFKLSDDSSSPETGSNFLSGCHTRPDNSNGNTEECPYITNLGGASPDYNGNIEITIDTDDTVKEVYSSAKIRTVSTSTITDCGVGNSCASVQLDIKEKDKPREAMEFGQCGNDLCEEIRETKKVANDTMYPLRGKGIAYSENRLYSLRGESVIATEESGSYIQGVFQREGNGCCGISWDGTNHELRYDGETFSMDAQRVTISTSAETIILTLSVEDGTLTGTLRVNDTVLETLTCPGTSLGVIGVILENWVCVDWRIQ